MKSTRLDPVATKLLDIRQTVTLLEQQLTALAGPLTLSNHFIEAVDQIDAQGVDDAESYRYAQASLATSNLDLLIAQLSALGKLARTINNQAEIAIVLAEEVRDANSTMP